jgi:hypothetical protein
LELAMKTSLLVLSVSQPQTTNFFGIFMAFLILSLGV